MYRQFLKFMLPLMLAMVVMELSGQVVTGGMARVPRAVETLAAFGVAYGLMTLLANPLYQSRQLGLALVDGPASLALVHRCVILGSVACSVIEAVIALTPAGEWLVEGLHGIDPTLGAVVREALLWMIPVPAIQGVTRFYSGLVARVRRTDVVSAATILGIVTRVGMVFLLLPAEFIQEKPILLPVLATFFSALVELAVTAWGVLRFVRGRIPQGNSDAALTLGGVVQFFWPLALIMTIQAGSRPLVNLMVSRGTDGPEALAVLTLAYTLGHVHYGWLNELRSLAPAFREMADVNRHIKRFTVTCSAVSLAIAFAVFWTPAGTFILESWIGATPRLAELCVAPLMIFTFFPFPVSLRAYCHGVGLVTRRTKALAPSAPSRIVAIWVAMLALPAWPGATRGIAALFCGFLAEATVTWWGVIARGAKAERESGAVR